METCKDLPELELNINGNHKDVFRLLELIKPNWIKEEVKIKILSGGYSCTMLRCTYNAEDSVTVRVRKLMVGLRNPIPELQVVKAISCKGYFPPLLATFQNGYCYEYVSGRPLVMPDSTELMIDERQLRLIAEQMANTHAVVVPEHDYTRTSYFDFFTDLVSKSKPWFEGCPSMEEIIKEILIVEKLMSVVNSPLVLCHCDPHPANFVWDEDDKKLTFVDWEIAQVAPRASDIAYFLTSFENFGYFFKLPVLKPVDTERKFCEYYLYRWNELHNKPPPTVGDFEKLWLEFSYFTLMVKLISLVFLIKFETASDDFGPIESSWKYNLERYLKAKEEVIGVEKLGLSAVPNLNFVE